MRSPISKEANHFRQKAGGKHRGILKMAKIPNQLVFIFEPENKAQRQQK